MTIAATPPTASGSHTGARLVAAASAALLILGAGAASAHSGKGEIKTIAVNAHYTEPAGSFDGARCPGLATASPSCVTLFSGYATFTGTLYGDEYYELDGSATPDGKITYEGAAFFTGGVKGCGKGTYAIDVTEGYTDMKKYDPLTDSAKGFAKWQVRPGSGTGDLTNLVSGSGEIVWMMHGKGFANIGHFGEGDFTGKIRCRT